MALSRALVEKQIEEARKRVDSRKALVEERKKEPKKDAVLRNLSSLLKKKEKRLKAIVKLEERDAELIAKRG